MIIDNKEIIFHIENSAYTVNIGPDLNNEIIDGLKKFLDINQEISIPQLLSAYLRMNSELIELKKGVENQVKNIVHFTS
ncbi:hypothetical protein MNB_ARC-1_759 [hydrothermal vent metagenome]|uniref:Uncharacterized protein n=1 Tax=hydrothermal vent metagenome TaxID=652676 RepID=A0A3B1DY54_9ZZZZ